MRNVIAELGASALPDAAALDKIIQQAFLDARAERKSTPRERSMAWVESLARQFDNHFKSAEGIGVLRKTRPSKFFDRGSQSRSEFLFDVLVCRFGQFAPPVHQDGKPIDFIEESLIQIESEFERSTAASAEDFSKLVCGSAKMSLFVGPSDDRGHYRNALAEIARFVPSEHLYAAFLPHPETWDDDARGGPVLYRWDGDGWQPVTVTSEAQPRP